MSVEENRDYYIVDNGFVSILVDKHSFDIANTNEIENAYGGRTPAYNNAIAYAKRKANEYENNKKNEIRRNRDELIRASAMNEAARATREEYTRMNDFEALRRYKKLEMTVSTLKQTVFILILILVIIIVAVVVCYPVGQRIPPSAPKKRQDSFYL